MEQDFSVICQPRILGNGRKFRCCKVDYSNRTFLALDLSTRKLNAVIVNANLQVIFSTHVTFDIDLPEFNTENGLQSGELPNEYFVNPVMWIKALDIVINSLESQGADLSTVAAISGAAQPNGSVYWSEKGYRRLCGLSVPKRLHELIDESAFAVKLSPICMNSSTNRQCIDMTVNIGTDVSVITGSKCIPHFTSSQIRKINLTQFDEYKQTERISLVSSFLASLFIGNIAPIDNSDGSTMNLLDIINKDWSLLCLDACAPDLRKRLMMPVPSTSLAGHIHRYYVERWGFRPDCMIATFTGNIQSEFAGMFLDDNSLLLSLGINDNIMMNLKTPSEFGNGHILCHPTKPNEFLRLFSCPSSPKLRDEMCQQMADGNWNTFYDMLQMTPPGNSGNMALYFQNTQSMPHTKSILRWDKESRPTLDDTTVGLDNFESNEIEIRALLEGQFLNHRNAVTEAGFHLSEDTKIIVTGKASQFNELLQLIADIFNAPVYRYRPSTSASNMGAAFRARYAFYVFRESACNCCACNKPNRLCFDDFIKSIISDQTELSNEPDPDNAKIYTSMLERYNDMKNELQNVAPEPIITKKDETYTSNAARSIISSFSIAKNQFRQTLSRMRRNDSHFAPHF